MAHSTIELLERFDLVGLVSPFQRGEVELAFLRIDGKGRVAGYSAVHFSSDGHELCPEVNQVPGGFANLNLA